MSRMVQEAAGLSFPQHLHAAYVFDLDGTIYLGEELLPGAARLIAELRRREIPVRFLSNNPTKDPVMYAAMLTLCVLLPRSLLALWAALRAAWLARRLPLPVGALYFQRLLHELRGDAGHVHLRPHGAAPSVAVLAGAKALLAAVLGDAVQLSTAPVVSYGQEDSVPPAPAGSTLQLLLADLAATPEDDTHGRLLQSARTAAPGVPVLLLVDEAAFAARFASLPSRLAERRAAWQRWADTHHTRLLLADLSQPLQPAALAALQAALSH